MSWRAAGSAGVNAIVCATAGGTATQAAALDSISVADWLARHVRSRGARAMLEIATHAIFAAEPADISLLYFLHYTHAGGSFTRMAEVRERDPTRHPLEPEDRQPELDQRERGDPRQQALVGATCAGELEHLATLQVLRERLDPERPGQREHAILGRSHPLSAEVHGLAQERRRQRPPADAVARLEHAQRDAGLAQSPRRDQAREARAGHHHL